VPPVSSVARSAEAPLGPIGLTPGDGTLAGRGLPVACTGAPKWELLKASQSGSLFFLGALGVRHVFQALLATLLGRLVRWRSPSCPHASSCGPRLLVTQGTPCRGRLGVRVRPRPPRSTLLPTVIVLPPASGATFPKQCNRTLNGGEGFAGIKIFEEGNNRRL